MKSASREAEGKGMFKAMIPSRRETRDGVRTFWTRAGVGFQNAPRQPGQPGSITIKLDALPPGGELVLFPFDDGPPEGSDDPIE